MILKRNGEKEEYRVLGWKPCTSLASKDINLAMKNADNYAQYVAVSGQTRIAGC